MPAKKPAPKAAKGKKAASRPPVHKSTVARKPAERVQAERFHEMAPATHDRHSAEDAVVPKKAVPPRSTPTTEDTIDKVSAASLQVVGDVAVALVR